MKIALNQWGARDGFTLIEVILAIGIMAIVLVTVNTAFFSALRLREKTQDLVDSATPVDQTMATIERDLEGVITPTNGTTKVLSGGFRAGNGTAAVEMFTTTGTLGDKEPWGDIQQVTYELRTPAGGDTGQGKDLYRSVLRNILTATTPQEDDQWMMSGVQNITFSGYDGSQWSSTWDTTGLTSANTNLPVAVRVDIQPAGNQLAPIEIIVPIDVQARTNMVFTTTE